ncbi:hypothetical protein VNI00_016188 [Paramarasmius palmivorus]|uniref:Uncharacterized protein n=1 Tax=Paramarasmius palmivorus TaxID=297713 RepID=A0AAW0BDT0_9AGAR
MPTPRRATKRRCTKAPQEAPNPGSPSELAGRNPRTHRKQHRNADMTSPAQTPPSLTPLPVLASLSFNLVNHLSGAEESQPPITLEQDLGPNSIDADLWLELFGGDLTDLSDWEDEEEVPDPVEPKKRLRLDCVEIPVVRRRHHGPQSKKNSKHREKRRLVKVSLGPKRRFRMSRHSLGYVFNHAETVPVAFSATQMDSAKGAHTRKRGPSVSDQRPPSLRRMLNAGFQRIAWDGCTPRPIVDRDGRVIAVLCGWPSGGSYQAALDSAFGAIMAEGGTAPFGVQATTASRRGAFPAYNVGCAMGMGSSRPVALRNGAMGPALQRLLNHEGVRRMASYHNAAFALWAPRLYRRYEETSTTMYQNNPTLPRNFPDSVFTAATFNFGGNVWTYKHRDFFNWAYGWCFVTALGDFDATRGGQMVLWELELVIDFPHAATIALPSAVITHSNIPVASGDKRVSFTQYSAGPIFRWVENGCQTEKEMEQEDPTTFAEMMAGKSTAHLARLALYSTMDKLMQTL